MYKDKPIKKKKYYGLVVLSIFCIVSYYIGRSTCANNPKKLLRTKVTPTELPTQLPIANEIREGMKNAFNSYMRDAWKMDEYKPISKRGENTFGGKGLTIIDSLDTLYLMDLKDEFAKAEKFVRDEFVFGGKINVFEMNIRVLGGLLSTYTLTDNKLFLEEARKVGDKLLLAFQKRIPCGVIDERGNCGYQHRAGGRAINAEVGTLSLEFETLSHLTNDPTWSHKIQKINEYWDNNHKGLLQMYINPNTEKQEGKRTIGGGIDSTYEYFLKLSLMNSDKLAKKLYDTFERKIYLSMFTKFGNTTFPKQDHSNVVEHLGCFLGGMFILGDKFVKEGLEFTETCARMYTSTKSGIACDHVTIQKDGNIVCKNDIYFLRPEVVESIFYAWRHTHDQKWRNYATKIWNAINKHCKVNTGGFTVIKNLNSINPTKLDKQESWFLAETLKYLWLIFQPDDVLPLDEYVFNTEAHPLKKFNIVH